MGGGDATRITMSATAAAETALLASAGGHRGSHNSQGGNQAQGGPDQARRLWPSRNSPGRRLASDDSCLCGAAPHPT